MTPESSTNGIARHLLEADEDRLAELAPRLMDQVAEEFGMPPLSVDHKWPVDVIEAIREFLVCVATDDEARLTRRGGTFESVGVEAARGGLQMEVLADSIRMAARILQARAHRAVLADPRAFDPELVLELLSRVLTSAEVVITTARRGYDLAGVVGDDEEELGRHLAGELVVRGRRVLDLASRIGWDPASLVCAVITTPAGAARIVSASVTRPAYFARTQDVVLALPVAADRLATTLRPLLSEVDCTVGPAVPITEFPDSLALTQRLSDRSTGAAGGPSFVDDALLELACVADPMVVRALRRKHFSELDALPSDGRATLLETLHQWLLQWGHRPGIAEALDVHPQTVSGRINRLKDLLADDLEDPTVRAELLVLLTAEGAS